ncbi:hypothetical protein ACRAWD_15495 [Caulobacter segnis]
MNPELPGFAFRDNGGRWRGFNVDFLAAPWPPPCWASPIRSFSFPWAMKNASRPYARGKVDVLWRNTSWTFSRDAGDQLDMAAISYFDGPGLPGAPQPEPDQRPSS